MNRYAWADTDYDLAWTVAVVEGRTTQEVLAAYGGREGDAHLAMTCTAAQVERTDGLDGYGFVQLRQHVGNVLAIEPNGWVGNAPDVARRLSGPAGSFFSVYWSPSAHQLVQAKDGQLVARFDPTFIGLPAGANDLLPAGSRTMTSRWITCGLPASRPLNA